MIDTQFIYYEDEEKKIQNNIYLQNLCINNNIRN